MAKKNNNNLIIAAIASATAIGLGYLFVSRRQPASVPPPALPPATNIFNPAPSTTNVAIEQGVNLAGSLLDFFGNRRKNNKKVDPIAPLPSRPIPPLTLSIVPITN